MSGSNINADDLLLRGGAFIFLVRISYLGTGKFVRHFHRPYTCNDHSILEGTDICEMNYLFRNLDLGYVGASRRWAINTTSHLTACGILYDKSPYDPVPGRPLGSHILSSVSMISLTVD